ncbi:DNA/RNA non-specific endonuclease [uncultured Psychroserpens sp.]|uniref:DNA/RNA non-specific endonuclease n=1 Tax=uncultured Psychroserpens sp. TaxID=255436 RepID=UPI002635BF51|nr:DNA/RNA non-specific endonuclease [uncultured Psychroserpens sp.]
MSYNKNFIPNFEIEVPSISKKQRHQYEQAGLNLDRYYLNYINYSVLQNPFRKFPYFSATNIDGSQFIEKLDRKDDFDKDDRIPLSHQFGKELYSAYHSDFDRGHMTKREDTQWGTGPSVAKEAADSTFYYTNAVPQHARLNRSIWRRIENYILHTQGVKHKKKLIVFTGPILNQNDPVFVTRIDGDEVKIPRIFWKVIYYLNKNNDLSRVAFITNQSNLLLNNGIVEPTMEITRSTDGEDDYFLDFKDADTYQTGVHVIETLTGFSFQKATDVYEDDRIVRLILEEVNYRSSGEDESDTGDITNLKL